MKHTYYSRIFREIYEPADDGTTLYILAFANRDGDAYLFDPITLPRNEDLHVT